MKRIYALIALALFAFGAQAQTTVNQVQPGSLTVTGCPGGHTPCFVPYSDANPLPTTATISGSFTVTAAPTNASAGYVPVTVGTTSSTVAAAASATVFLDLVNASNTATVCCNVGAAATITGTQCDAGEIPLPPGWHRSYENSLVPTDAVNCIASAAATQFTVGKH